MRTIHRVIGLFPAALLAGLLVSACTSPDRPYGADTSGPEGAGGTGAAGGGSTASVGGGTATSSSAGSTGGGGSAAGGGGATSSSSGSGVSEDCQNGLDDDRDGSIDCADTECVPDFECVDAAPPEWTGYFHVTLSPYPGPDSPTCGDGAVPERLFADPAGPAECEACTCGPLQNAACGPVPLHCYTSSTTCGGIKKELTNGFDQNDICDKPGFQGAGSNTISCVVPGGATVDKQGQCQPSKAGFSNKDLWESRLDACPAALSAGGCSGGQVCVPKPLNPPAASLCIRHADTATCPAGWPVEIDGFLNGFDTRSCSNCTCAPKPTCTGGSYTIYDLDQCMLGGAGTLMPVDLVPGQCTDVSMLLDQGTWSIKKTLPTVGGDCTPGGGAPTGSVLTTGQTTYCCR